MSEIHRELGLPEPSLPILPPDPFRAQLAAVIEAKPAAFSFTFGIPDAEAMAALRAAGIGTLGTATSLREGHLLAKAGVDAAIAQGAEAGAHRGTFAGEDAPVLTLDLVRDLASHLTVPVIAAGGIMTGNDVARAVRAGAEAVQMGTAFLACDEAGTSAPYREALLHAHGEQTVLTRAFSGRAARGLRNAFIDRVGERDELILPYPIQNSLTRPMRAAAAAKGNAEYLSFVGWHRRRPNPADARRRARGDARRGARERHALALRQRLTFIVDENIEHDKQVRVVRNEAGVIGDQQ
jgi:nitronate monooxygenase